MNEYIKLRYGFETFEEYVEVEYTKIYAKEEIAFNNEKDHFISLAEGLPEDNPIWKRVEGMKMILSDDFSYEIKGVIVGFLDSDNIPRDFSNVPRKSIQRINDDLSKAMELIENYPDSWQCRALHAAPEYNPFKDAKPYKPKSQAQCSKDHRDKFLNELESLGLTAKKAKEIFNLLITL